MTLASRLSEIVAVAERATPGPWHVDDRDPLVVWTSAEVAMGMAIVRPSMRHVAAITADDPYPRGDNHPSENMAFIAASSPSVVSALAKVAIAAEAFVPEPQVVQWERREIALRDALATLSDALTGGDAK